MKVLRTNPIEAVPVRSDVDPTARFALTLARQVHASNIGHGKPLRQSSLRKRVREPHLVSAEPHASEPQAARPPHDGGLQALSLMNVRAGKVAVAASSEPAGQVQAPDESAAPVVPDSEDDIEVYLDLAALAEPPPDDGSPIVLPSKSDAELLDIGVEAREVVDPVPRTSASSIPNVIVQRPLVVGTSLPESETHETLPGLAAATRYGSIAHRGATPDAVSVQAQHARGLPSAKARSIGLPAHADVVSPRAEATSHPARVEPAKAMPPHADPIPPHADPIPPRAEAEPAEAMLHRDQVDASVAIPRRAEVGAAEAVSAVPARGLALNVNAQPSSPSGEAPIHSSVRPPRVPEASEVAAPVSVAPIRQLGAYRPTPEAATRLAEIDAARPLENLEQPVQPSRLAEAEAPRTSNPVHAVYRSDSGSSDVAPPPREPGPVLTNPSRGLPSEEGRALNHRPGASPFSLDDASEPVARPAEGDIQRPGSSVEPPFSSRASSSAVSSSEVSWRDQSSTDQGLEDRLNATRFEDEPTMPEEEPQLEGVDFGYEFGDEPQSGDSREREPSLRRLDESRSSEAPFLAEELADRIDRILGGLGDFSIDAIQTTDLDGGDETAFEMSHPELGSLRIHLAFEDGALDVRITSASPTITRRLTAMSSQLRDELASARVRVGRVRIETQGSETASAVSRARTNVLNVEA